MTAPHRTPLRLRIARGFAVAVIVCSLATLIACSTQSSKFSSLLNQGIMPVSEENAFMGANLFLAREMEQSVYLYNFMKERGAPQGIELKGDSEVDVEAHFYYTAGPEEYLAKPAPEPRFNRNQNTRREWIIIGPFAVDKERYREIQQLAQTNGGSFEIFGRREFLGQHSSPGTQVALRPVFVPTAIPPKKHVVKKKPSVDTSAPFTSNGKEPMNFDQQALKEAKDLAPRDSHGDVVHTVASKTETLQSISQWYTSKSTSAAELAKKNGLPEDAKLSPGAKIIVPKNLITNPKRMQ
ncbi:MAG: hypothetical protein RIS36_1541 [Pseudomonadota bacterium]